MIARTTAAALAGSRTIRTGVRGRLRIVPLLPLGVALALTACAIAVTGCGITNPTTPTTSATPERPRTPVDVVDAQRHPLVRLAVDYTLTQATWSPSTYVAQRGRLAERATGQARAQLTPRDGQSPAGVAASLKAAGASSSATLLGTDGPSARHQVVVAYKTTATGAGHAAGGLATYAIAHVTLTRHHGRWLVSRFEIQP